MGASRQDAIAKAARVVPAVAAVQETDAPSAPVPLPAGPASAPATLQVGHAEDHAEHDADRRADVALARLRSSTETKAPAEVDAHRHGVSCGHLRRSEAPGATGVIGREGGALSADADARISRLRPSGQALPTPVRNRMETAFGTSLSGVKIHDNAESAGLSREMSARAFTTGKDIFFGAGEFRPDTADGERTLAHEVAHTLQGDTGARRTIRRLDPAPAATRPPPLPPRTPEMLLANKKAQDARESRTDRVVDRVGSVGEGTGVVDSVGETNDYLASQAKLDGKDEAPSVGSDRDQTNLGYAGAAAGGLGFFVEMAGAITAFRRASGEDKSWKRFEAVMGGAGAAASTASTMAGATKTAQGGDGKDTAYDTGTKDADGKAVMGTRVEGAAPAATLLADAIMKEITGGISTIKALYEAIQSFWDACKADAETDWSKKTDTGIGILRKTGDAAKAAMELTNSFYTHLGTVTGPMLHAVPGLGIAMSVLDVLANALKICISYKGAAAMRSDKQEAKEILMGARDLQKNKTYFGLGTKSGQSVADETLADDLLVQSLRAQGLFAVGTDQAAIDAEASRLTKVQAAKDYHLAHDIQEIADKRINRSLLNVGKALLTMSAQIALITGAGAGAAVGLAAAAAAIGAGSVLLRNGKQFLNDQGWGDDKKSTKAKVARYDQHIGSITGELQASKPVAGEVGPAATVKAKRLARAMNQMDVVGPDTKELAKVRGTATEGADAWKIWLDAMRNRDL